MGGTNENPKQLFTVKLEDSDFICSCGGKLFSEFKIQNQTFAKCNICGTLCQPNQERTIFSYLEDVYFF